MAQTSTGRKLKASNRDFEKYFSQHYSVLVSYARHYGRGLWRFAEDAVSDAFEKTISACRDEDAQAEESHIDNYVKKAIRSYFAQYSRLRNRFERYCLRGPIHSEDIDPAISTAYDDSIDADLDSLESLYCWMPEDVLRFSKSIVTYRANPHQIASKLGLSEDQFHASLRQLRAWRRDLDYKYELWQLLFGAVYMELLFSKSAAAHELGKCRISRSELYGFCQKRRMHLPFPIPTSVNEVDVAIRFVALRHPLMTIAHHYSPHLKMMEVGGLLVHVDRAINGEQQVKNHPLALTLANIALWSSEKAPGLFRHSMKLMTEIVQALSDYPNPREVVVYE
jgi:DNA-directed RNA polymerase specialized sigma24 family protein